MSGFFNEAGSFLIQTLFGLYILVIMLRFLLQWVKADFYNPLSQFVVKVTNPPLLPLRKIIPGLFNLDMAALVLALALQIVEYLLIGQMTGQSVSFIALILLSLLALVKLVLYIFLVSIIIEAVFSWINPGSYNPMIAVIHQLNAPLLRPARRLIPPVGGMDLSPLAVLIVLQLLIMAVPYLFASFAGLIGLTH